MCLNLKEGAFIVSDAHYSLHHNPQLKTFLKQIDSNILKPTQLIFMGDIFDALFAPVNYTIRQNQDMIDIINNIANKIEVIYLEGNHDFFLEKIFENIKIYPINLQPIMCKYKEKIVFLAHGDFGESLKYKIYTSIIRSYIMLSILKYLDILGNHFILKKLDSYLQKKDDCQNFKNFKKYIIKRLEYKYAHKCDIFLEGHFHQDVKFQIKKMLYVNLPAFACNQRYFIVKSYLMERNT